MVEEAFLLEARKFHAFIYIIDMTIFFIDFLNIKKIKEKLPLSSFVFN